MNSASNSRATPIVCCGESCSAAWSLGTWWPRSGMTSARRRRPNTEPDGRPLDRMLRLLTPERRERVFSRARHGYVRLARGVN